VLECPTKHRVAGYRHNTSYQTTPVLISALEGQPQLLLQSVVEIIEPVSRLHPGPGVVVAEGKGQPERLSRHPS